MKEIIYNSDGLKEENINNYVNRAKMIIENNKGELLLAYCNNNYFLIGGHVESDESFDMCIIREIKEESGVEIPFEKRSPFLSIKYYNKNYPNKGLNTKNTINYYYIKYDLIPDENNMSLEQGEKDGGFKLIYIDKNKTIEFLKNSLENCSNPAVVEDTILAVKEYLALD